MRPEGAAGRKEEEDKSCGYGSVAKAMGKACVCVCVCVCVCACTYTHAYGHLCLPQSLLPLIETEPLLHLELTEEPASLRDPPVSASPTLGLWVQCTPSSSIWVLGGLSVVQ